MGTQKAPLIFGKPYRAPRFVFSGALFVSFGAGALGITTSLENRPVPIASLVSQFVLDHYNYPIKYYKNY